MSTKLGVYKPGSGFLELRFTNLEDQTEVWLIPEGAVDFGRIQGLNQVKLAYVDYGVDIRLANQRYVIDRLQKHVEAHHLDIADGYDMPDKAWACTYRDDDDAAPTTA
jgi:hypothetical protein